MQKSKKIERMRERMHNAIDKYGINSDEVRKISERLDKLIYNLHSHEKEFPVDSIMKECYYISMEELKEITQNYGEFPTVKEWNKYATDKVLLSNLSIEYISGLNWSKLERYISQEIK